MDKLAIQQTIKEAMGLAASNPGPNGGRYVGRKYNKKTQKGEYIILETDNPDELHAMKDWKSNKLDVFAHVLPTKCYGIGYARNWLNQDGTVHFED